jgi:hypothetical protein
MVDLTLNAVRYPLQKILAAPVTADEQLEGNGTLSNGTKVRGGLSGRPAFAFGVHRRDDFGHDAAIWIIITAAGLVDERSGITSTSIP